MNIDDLFEKRAQRGNKRDADDVLAQARPALAGSSPEPAESDAGEVDVLVGTHDATSMPDRGPRRGRLVVLGAATFLLCIWIASSLSSDSRSSSRVSTNIAPEPTNIAPEPDVTEPTVVPDDSSEVSFARGPDAPPRVVISRPEFELWNLEEAPEGLWPEFPSTDGDPEGYFSIYRDVDAGFDGTLLVLLTLELDPLEDEELSEGEELIEINSRPAVLGYADGHLGSYVVWDDNTGGLVLFGLRTSADQLIKAAESLIRNDDGTLAITAIPPELELTATETFYDVLASPYDGYSYEYSLGDVSGSLYVISSFEVFMFLNIIGAPVDADRSQVQIASAKIGDTEVALLESSDDLPRTALWWAEGLMFTLETSAGSLEELAEIVEDIIVVDEATWQSNFVPATPTAGPDVPPNVIPPPPDVGPPDMAPPDVEPPTPPPPPTSLTTTTLGLVDVSPEVPPPSTIIPVTTTTLGPTN